MTRDQKCQGSSSDVERGNSCEHVKISKVLLLKILGWRDQH